MHHLPPGDLVRIVLHPTDARLAAAAAESNEIILVDGRSLRVLDRIPTAAAPSDLLLTDDGPVVLESGQRQITSYRNDGTPTARRSLGAVPSRLTTDQHSLYVGTGRGITVLDLQTLTVNSRIAMKDAAAGDLLLEPTRRWLYAVVPRTGAIAVIDTTSRRLHGRIEVGAPVADLALLQ